MANSQKLLDGRMEPGEFLDKIVYKQNEDDFGLLNTEYLNPIIEDDDEEVEPDENSEYESEEIAPELPKGLCILCYEKTPEMCVVPCFDFCMCEPCFFILKSNSADFRCPKCHIVASDAKKMNFV